MQMDRFNPAKNPSDMAHPGEGGQRVGARKKGTSSSAMVPGSGAATELDHHTQHHSNIGPDLVQRSQIPSSEQNIIFTNMVNYNTSVSAPEPTHTPSTIGVPVISIEARRRIKDEERRQKERQKWSWWLTNLPYRRWWIAQWRWCTCCGIVACCVAILSIAIALSSASRICNPATSTLGQLVGHSAEATSPSLEKATRLQSQWVKGNASAFSGRISQTCSCYSKDTSSQNKDITRMQVAIENYCEAPRVDGTGPEKENNDDKIWHFRRLQMAQNQVGEILTDAYASSACIATKDLAEGLHELACIFEKEKDSMRMMQRRQGVQAIEDEEPGLTTHANTQSYQSRGQERGADLVVWLRWITSPVHGLFFSKPPARSDTATEVIRLLEMALNLHDSRFEQLSHALQDLKMAVVFSASEARLIDTALEKWTRTSDKQVRVRPRPADLKYLLYTVILQGQNAIHSISMVQGDVDKTRDRLKVWMKQVQEWKKQVKTAVTESNKLGNFHGGGALSTEHWLQVVKIAAELLPELNSLGRAYVV